MMVSDKLKNAIDPTKREMWIEDWGETLSRAVADAIPRIEALERLLEKHQWDGEIGVCVECGSPVHRPDCEITKVLKATP